MSGEQKKGFRRSSVGRGTLTAAEEAPLQPGRRSSTAERVSLQPGRRSSVAERVPLPPGRGSAVREVGIGPVSEQQIQDAPTEAVVSPIVQHNFTPIAQIVPESIPVVTPNVSEGAISVSTPVRPFIPSRTDKEPLVGRTGGRRAARAQQVVTPGRISEEHRTFEIVKEQIAGLDVCEASLNRIVEGGRSLTGRIPISGRRVPSRAVVSEEHLKGQKGSPPDAPSPPRERDPAPEMTMCRRPGFGLLGRRYPMRANFFELTMPSNNIHVYRYYIQIVHERIVRILPHDNRRIFWKFVINNVSLFPVPHAIAYDGTSILFSLVKLDLPEKVASSLYDVECELTDDERKKTFSLSIRLTGELTADLTEAIVGVGDYTLEPIQILDIVFRQYRQNPYGGMATRYYPFRTNVYQIPFAQPPGRLNSCLEVWEGFYQSVRVCESYKPYLNVDLKYSTFFNQLLSPKFEEPYSVIDFLCDVLNWTVHGDWHFDPHQLNSESILQPTWVQQITKEFTGLRVRTTHRPERNSTQRVFQLGPSALEKRFTNKEGVEITVAGYFQAMYGRPLRYPRLQTLEVGTRNRRTYLPMEVCNVEQKQRYARKLDDKQTSEMIKIAARPANERYAKTNKMMEDAGFREGIDPFMKKFDLGVKMNMAEVEGRVLASPRIILKNKAAKDFAVQISDQNVWRYDNDKFYEGSTIKGVVLIQVVSRRYDNECNAYIVEQLRTLKAMGCDVPFEPDEHIYCEEITADEVERALRRAREVMITKGNPLVIGCVPNGIVIIILPRRDPYIYARIKYVAEVQVQTLPTADYDGPPELGFATQVVLLNTITNKRGSPCANIALKINLKLRGINSGLDPDKTIKDYFKDTLFLGIDVIHPSPLDKVLPSIAAIVANINSPPTKYSAVVKLQRQRRESIVYLIDAVKEHLFAYFRSAGHKPQRIIVYRDGVGEGQFQEVLREELRSIKDACTNLDSQYKPKITFIIVAKRHNTRLYPMDKGVGRAGNVQPGVVLDRTIMHPKINDFYLCSHFGIQGTSRPAKYSVLYDDSEFSADELQMITYCLTFVYQRCSRAVSIPGPTYYAHLACERAHNHALNLLSQYDPDAASQSSGGVSGGHQRELLSFSAGQWEQAIKVASCLKESMYFV